jgi:glyoxylase-like metal-dependent hydrolase (beta-lactamase superfamily II)
MDCFQIKGLNDTYLVYRVLFVPVKSNMYILIKGSEAIVIDPCVSEDAFMLLKENRVNHVSILLTHEHYDHTNGVMWMQSIVASTLYCQKDCAASISIEKRNNPTLVALVLADQDKVDGGNRYKEFRKSFQPYSLKADVTFDNDVEWNIGGFRIKGVSTPGHSPGSCFYFIDERVAFSGDSLLEDKNVILTFRNGSEADYEKRTRPYLKSLDKDIMLLPGHGDPFLIQDAKFL